jgi:hypothetical protein
VRQVAVNLAIMDRISRLSPVDNLVSDEVAVFGMSLTKDRDGILQQKYNRDAETNKQYFKCNTCFAIPDEGVNDALTFRPLSSISV